MPYIVKDSKKDYTPAPEGLHQAVCVDVVDLGIVKSQYGDQPKIEIRWVLDDLDPKTEKPYMVVSRFTPSLHEKSRLRPLLEAWRGRRFSVEELKGFDIEKLLGANCQIQIVHNITNDGQTYANVQAVVPIAKNSAKLAIPADYIRVSEREHRAELEKHPDGNGKTEDEYIPF